MALSSQSCQSPLLQEIGASHGAESVIISTKDLIWVSPLFFEQRQAAFGSLLLCSKNNQIIMHTICVPCSSILWANWGDNYIFGKDSFFQRKSWLSLFWIKILFFFWSKLQPAPDFPSTMHTFGNKILAQPIVLPCPRIFWSSGPDNLVILSHITSSEKINQSHCLWSDY